MLNEFLSYFKDLNDPYMINIFLGVNVFAFVLYILSLIEHNSSQTDRFWPLMPSIYSYIYLYVGIKYKGLEDHPNTLMRLLIMTAIITVWSLRLTWHFWRKGYYRWGNEDYRWTKVRKSYGPVRFFIFNLLFIGFFQNWVLFSLNIAMWYMIQHGDTNEPLNAVDYVLFGLMVFFYLYEAIADEQQWSYQTNKYKYLDSQKTNAADSAKKYNEKQIEEFKRGFLIKGLFKYSRHPNYFGDLGLWWTVYFFTLSSQLSTKLAASNYNYSSFFNWSIFAMVIFNFLFQCSTDITEKLSRKKYAEYAAYQSRVWRIIPFFTNYNPSSTSTETKKDK